ncbi:Mycobacterium numidiamassiliense ORFan [Mycobacterium numidiamassiliense]|uniref:Mycobacterium numidiamassiliense ORFan n=1 Tax=Mycobacterium numidiamassiliense TaxID=1841861 RepID=A0A2U3P439_9MYCO|nr:Mycobacterium numidiamassiliense ORFan [Mycobacterium numidiamassiliense]
MAGGGPAITFAHWQIGGITRLQTTVLDDRIGGAERLYSTAERLYSPQEARGRPARGEKSEVVGAQLVHYYFASMDDLLSALVRQATTRSRDAFARALASPKPLRALWEVSSDPDVTALTAEMR